MKMESFYGGGLCLPVQANVVNWKVIALRQRDHFASSVNKISVVFQPHSQFEPMVIMVVQKCLIACIFGVVTPYTAAIRFQDTEPVMGVSACLLRMPDG